MSWAFIRRFLATASIFGLLTLCQCVSAFRRSFDGVSILSDPAGSEVFVDKERLGRTPLIANLKHGEHHFIELKQDGYKDANASVVRSLQMPGFRANWTIEKSVGYWKVDELKLTAELKRTKNGMNFH